MGDLKELYVRAAVKARCTPQRTEEGEWKRAFEYADSRDLSVAIDAFFDRASHSERGVWMPKVDELKPLIENARRARESRASAHIDFVVWRCPVCNSTMSGWPQDADMRRWCGAYRKTGGKCNTLMVEFLREAA